MNGVHWKTVVYKRICIRMLAMNDITSTLCTDSRIASINLQQFIAENLVSAVTFTCINVNRGLCNVQWSLATRIHICPPIFEPHWCRIRFCVVPFNQVKLGTDDRRLISSLLAISLSSAPCYIIVVCSLLYHCRLLLLSFGTLLVLNQSRDNIQTLSILKSHRLYHGSTWNKQNY